MNREFEMSQVTKTKKSKEIVHIEAGMPLYEKAIIVQKYMNAKRKAKIELIDASVCTFKPELSKPPTNMDNTVGIVERT